MQTASRTWSEIIRRFRLGFFFSPIMEGGQDGRILPRSSRRIYARWCSRTSQDLFDWPRKA